MNFITTDLLVVILITVLLLAKEGPIVVGTAKVRAK